MPNSAGSSGVWARHGHLILVLAVGALSAVVVFAGLLVFEKVRDNNGSVTRDSVKDVVAGQSDQWSEDLTTLPDVEQPHTNDLLDGFPDVEGSSRPGEGSPELTETVKKTLDFQPGEPDPLPAPASEAGRDTGSAAEPGLSPELEWWCLCYEEVLDGVPTSSTACRKTLKACDKITEAIRTGRHPFVAGSISRPCTTVRGKRPWDALGQFEAWKPSSREGNYWSDRGCLLP